MYVQKFGHFSGREVRGKSSSVTSHRIPRNVRVCNNSVPDKSVVYKRVSEQYFNHIQASEGN